MYINILSGHCLYCSLWAFKKSVFLTCNVCTRPSMYSFSVQNSEFATYVKIIINQGGNKVEVLCIYFVCSLTHSLHLRWSLVKTNEKCHVVLAAVLVPNTLQKLEKSFKTNSSLGLQIWFYWVADWQFWTNPVYFFCLKRQDEQLRVSSNKDSFRGEREGSLN